MATEPKRKSVKSETLTIRLDPKTRFMLEFVSRLRGQTITTVVERAISAAADQATIEGEFDSSNWKDFWNVSDGIRALSIARAGALFPTYEEEKLLKFADEHSPFFMTTGFGKGSPRVPGGPFIDLLWPKIHEYQRVFDETKSSDFWAAGKQMAADIRAAGVKPPVWPPEPPAAKAGGMGGGGGRSSSSHLDDDIPF